MGISMFTQRNKKQPASPKKTDSSWAALSHRRKKEALFGLLFISPWLIGFLLFFAGPAVISFIMSFTKWNIVGDPTWIGLDNYIEIFSGDKNFWNSVGVTIRYAVLYIPLMTTLSIITALALNTKVKGIGIFPHPVLHAFHCSGNRRFTGFHVDPAANLWSGQHRFGFFWNQRPKLV